MLASIAFAADREKSSGNESVSLSVFSLRKLCRGQWIVAAISFQKIYGLCGLKRQTVEKKYDVIIVTYRQMDRGNVKIELEFCEADLQYHN